MARKKVLVPIPNDFRASARARFAKGQQEDASAFKRTLEGLGHEVEVLATELVEPRAAYLAVAEAVKRFKPDVVIPRCYLWADPPNGTAVIQATPFDIPMGWSAYIAPDGAPLGEAPGEVFILHETCAARAFGRQDTRLFGPLTGPGSDQTIQDLREFVEDGRIISNIDFPDFKLPIKESHTARAQEILADMRGRLMATTGGPSMGMHLLRNLPQVHFATGPKGGWGMNEPVIPPDLYYWMRRFEARRDYYMSLGRHYVQALVAQGFQFLFQRDYNGQPMPADERDYTPEVAALQMALYAVMLDICEENNIDILGIPAQLVMTDLVVAGDLLKGVAQSSWGPEGREEPLDWETEGDMDGGISTRTLRKVTRRAVGFADVRTFIKALKAWKMCNSGCCCSDLARGGLAGCFSARQYKGYFRAEGGGGTFAFLHPKPCNVVGLRVAADQDGPYGTVAIGRTVDSDDPSHVVDGRWPQLNIEIFADPREAMFKFVTNHKLWSESTDPINDACVLSEVVRLAAGGRADRVRVLYDGRDIPQAA